MPEENEVGKARKLRHLVPATDPASPATESTSPRDNGRRNLVLAACNTCRRHKAKCSGERPACHRCVRQRVPCQYSTQPGETVSQAAGRRQRDLQARAADLEELVELLKNLPDKDAQGVLQKIRTRTDIRTILNHVRDGDLLSQMAVLPESRFRYEFPYRSQMPADYIPNNPYLDSLIYEATSLYSSFSTVTAAVKGSPEGFKELNNHSYPGVFANRRSEEYKSLYLRPFHAAHVVDPRLTDVEISRWTTVCDDNVLMRDLLAEFFRCEYHFTAAFHKDLFLEDLKTKREDFCSSLLVNVVLGYSCVCYRKFSDRAEYWNPHTLLYRFIAEAKRLWELESTKPRITTIQAGIIFSVYHNLCGLDEIGQAYRLQAIDLAHQLYLFDSTVKGFGERIRRGRAFTAWTLYNWETLVGFSFVFAPLLRKPPDWQLPDPVEDPAWYGEIWIKYPLSDYLLPSYFGQVFKARSEFRVIMNQVCQAAYSEGSEMTLERASDFLTKLNAWYGRLPGPLQPKTIVLPGHLQVHIYYHHLLLTIYEPLLETKTIQAQQDFPRQIVANARRYLETLVRLYYLRHGFEAMDLFIVIPLMLTASDCINAIGEAHTRPSDLETLRSTLILAAKGLYSQRRNHYLAEALFRVVRGRMRPAEVGLLRGTTMDLKDEDVVKDNQGGGSGSVSGSRSGKGRAASRDKSNRMMQAVRSQWPVSVVRKREQLESNILTNLVESYANLNVDDDDDDDD